MAGDRRATANGVIVTDQVDKVMELDDTSLPQRSRGSGHGVRDGPGSADVLQYYRRSQLQVLSLPARVRALARLLGQSSADLTRAWVVPLFAGWMPRCNPPSRGSFFMIRWAPNSRR